MIEPHPCRKINMPKYVYEMLQLKWLNHILAGRSQMLFAKDKNEVFLCCYLSGMWYEMLISFFFHICVLLPYVFNEVPFFHNLSRWKRLLLGSLIYSSQCISLFSKNIRLRSYWDFHQLPIFKYMPLNFLSFGIHFWED